MPGFKVFRGSDVPGSTAAERIGQLLDLEPDRISAAVDIALQIRHGAFTAEQLGDVAEQLQLKPEAGIHALNAVRFLAGCLDSYEPSNADLAHDLELAGLSADHVQRLPQALDKIRSHARQIARADRELRAAHEGLPTITDFSASCDLRAVFSQPLGADDVLAPEPAPRQEEPSDVVAWLPIAIVTLETRDFAGESSATTFQAPLPILRNLVRALQKVQVRLETTVHESASRQGASGAGRGEASR